MLKNTFVQMTSRWRMSTAAISRQAIYGNHLMPPPLVILKNTSVYFTSQYEDSEAMCKFKVESRTLCMYHLGFHDLPHICIPIFGYYFKYCHLVYIPPFREWLGGGVGKIWLAAHKKLHPLLGVPKNTSAQACNNKSPPLKCVTKHSTPFKLIFAYTNSIVFHENRPFMPFIKNDCQWGIKYLHLPTTDKITPKTTNAMFPNPYQYETATTLSTFFYFLNENIYM